MVAALKQYWYDLKNNNLNNTIITFAEKCNNQQQDKVFCFDVMFKEDRHQTGFMTAANDMLKTA